MQTTATTTSRRALLGAASAPPLAALPVAVTPAGAVPRPDAALVARVEALHRHQAFGKAGGFTDEAMAEWCDREEAMFRELAQVRPTSLLDLLHKVNAAFDQLFYDDGSQRLLTFTEAELDLFGAAADDVKAAFRALAGGGVS